MKENLFEAQYDVTEKSKLKKFYESYKILIFSSVIAIVTILITISFYLNIKEKKAILLSDNYIEAKVLLENGDREKAKNILKQVILSDNKTYSTLSLFLILNENLIDDQKELSSLFDHLLENNKFRKEIKDLIIFKRALFKSSFISELELLEILKPLITKETLWKPNALLLIGDHFFSKGEYLKAKDFYIQTLSLKNLHKEFYEYARSQLVLISNE